MDKDLKDFYKCVNKLIEILLDDKAVKATKYVTDRLIIRATRRCYGGKIRKPFEVLLTMGKPNYSERAFIKKCKKAKEPFPIKKIQTRLLKTNPTKLPT